MATDPRAGALLRSLVASKPGGNFLELGTGVGASLIWMTEGLSSDASLTSVDNDPELIREVSRIFLPDPRISLVCQDGNEWIDSYHGRTFDLIFADAWPGKYDRLEPTLALLNSGGFYVIDDLLPQPNWPEGHQERVDHLLNVLSVQKNLSLCFLHYSSGVLIATRTG